MKLKYGCNPHQAPAEVLPEFNNNIVGDIEVIAEYKKENKP